MTIKQAFALYMVSLDLGTVTGDARNIYKNGVPEGAPDKCWWLRGGGGSPTHRNNTGERVKDYVVDVFYRNVGEEDVDETLQAFEELINSKHCDQLSGFDVVEIKASNMSSDQDLDQEDRFVGLVQVTITVYQHG